MLIEYLKTYIKILIPACLLSATLIVFMTVVLYRLQRRSEKILKTDLNHTV